MHAEYNKLSAKEKTNFDKNIKELRGHYSFILNPGISSLVSVKEGEMSGYACDVLTFAKRDQSHMTTYYLPGSKFPLRNETLSGGVMSVDFTAKIETGAVPDDAFVPPAGIEAVFNQEMDAKQTNKIKDFVAIMKKPDGIKEIMQPGNIQR